MKKLALMVAVFAVSLAVNAASVIWSVDYSYQMGTTDAAEGWSMFFFDNADVSRSTMIAAIASDNYATYVATYGGAASDLTDSDGYADGYSMRDTYGNPESITGYFVLFNADIDNETATYAYVSDTMTQSTGTTLGQNASFSFGDVLATQDADNWTAVPEPTSGLLLVVGGALLALRRRRLA